MKINKISNNNHKILHKNKKTKFLLLNLITHKKITKTKNQDNNHSEKINLRAHIIQNYQQLNNSQISNTQSNTQISSTEILELNQLIQKITQNFYHSQNQASFLINTGVFSGSEFYLHKNKNLLEIKIKNITLRAKKLLQKNHKKLTYKLAQKNIRISDIIY